MNFPNADTNLQIWQIADKENRGLLTPAGFGIVLRLIGHYQAGQDPTPELAFRPGPLPRFDGGLPGGPSVQPPPNVFTPALQPQSSGSGPIRVPPLAADKVAQYSGLFEKSGAQNGILPGEQAKQIFERAGLPNEVLGKIWNLADTEQRGALVMTEFIIAMHLLASYKSGAMRALPAILPAGLYDAAARRPQRQTSGSAPLSAIPRQFSGAGAGRNGSPLGRSGFAPPVQSPQSTGPSTGQVGEWAINPSDKARFDTIYTSLDRTNRGFITGDEAVPFFSNSKLPEEALAQIWDLADINSQGHLTRDEFAVAMYLIRQQRSKQDGRDNLPSTLPSNLIPPSMRNQTRQPQQPTAPTFDAQPQMPKSAMDDLFGLDALSSPSAPAPPQVPLSTGGSAGFNDPFNSRSPMTPSSPVQSSPQHPTGFKPFVPSSSFGRTLNYENTGGSNSSGQTTQRSIQPQTGMDDLLGEHDPETSKKLSGETMELANLSNQVGSLSKQMQDVQGQRAASQNELNQASTQKREFEGRLAQLRSLYEQEVKDVNGLKQTLSTTKNETQKLQQELAMVEGSHQDLQSQHQQIVQALQADQQENASLKERMRALNAEIAQLKPQLEKLRSEARQQKGLVAINKKQMSTSESERDKLKSEAEQLTKSNEENSKAIAASSQAQSPSNVASPALSTMSANNPFFRRQSSGADAVFSPFASQSPAPTPQAEHSFDNVFGPSFGASTPSSMPPTTFKQETAASHSVPFPAVETALPAASLEGSRVASPIPSQPTGSSRGLSDSDAPAPPASRQISSSFLPFSSAATESVSSSRQVSAPNSRFGEGSTGTETPTHQESTPTGSSAGGHEILATNSISHESNSIPGAFPGDLVAATPSGGSTLSERAMGTNNTGPIDPFAFNKPPAAAKDDFDSAFAGFGAPSNLKKEASERSGSATGSSNFHSEFPPLQELEHDDESDSGSEGGFEDDFTSASPGHSRKESALQSSSTPSRIAASGSEALAPPPSFTENSNSSAMSLGKDPPTEDAQRSPPPYNTTVSPHDRAQAEADQYAGLLPTREDSLSAPILSPEQSFQFVSTPSQSGESSKEAAKPAPAPPAKVPFDDFDNEFDDLEDAKEGTEDDDFCQSVYP